MKKRLTVGLMAGGLLAAMLPGVASAGAGEIKVSVCHYSADGSVHRLVVGQPAGAAHAAHGDFVSSNGIKCVITIPT